MRNNAERCLNFRYGLDLGPIASLYLIKHQIGPQGRASRRRPSKRPDSLTPASANGLFSPFEEAKMASIFDYEKILKSSFENFFIYLFLSSFKEENFKEFKR